MRIYLIFLLTSTLHLSRAAVISPLTFWTDGNTGDNYIYDSKSRSDALTSQFQCQGNGGNLLSIQSMADIEASVYSQAMQVNPSGALFWTGLQVIIPQTSAHLTDQLIGSTLRWSDGSPTTFISQQTGSMNLRPGCVPAPFGNTTCCGALYNAPSAAYMGGFPAIFFQPCVMLLPSMCVIPPPSPPPDAGGGGVASLGLAKPPKPPVKKSPHPPPNPPPFVFIGTPKGKPQPPTKKPQPPAKKPSPPPKP